MASLAPAEKAPAGKPLKVGSPHDPAEREADRIADILTAPEEPAMPVCAACAVGGAPCPACGGGGGGVLRRQVMGGSDGGSGGVMVAPASVHRVLSETGEPLPAGIRGKFERRLGADLEGVRVHRGEQAEQSAREVMARAYTVGHNVVLGERADAPHTSGGCRLLAHELAHVRQQQPELLQRTPEAEELVGQNTSLLNLDEAALAMTLKARILESNVAIVGEVMDELNSSDRDDVAFELVHSMSDEQLALVADASEGRLMLDRLYDELTAGSVAEEEATEAQRILLIKANRIQPEDFEAGMDSAKRFPFRLPGMTVFSDAPISAERRTGNRIWVKQPVRVLGTDEFRDETRTLPTAVFTSGLELPENEIVGVRLYDQGGEMVYRPALYLVQLANETTTTIMTKIGEVTAIGLTLSTGSLVAGAGEAGLFARALLMADRVAFVLSTLTSILREQRGWILSRFGVSGRRFLTCVDRLNSVLAIYGLARAAVGAVQTVNAARNALNEWRAAREALRLVENEERVVSEVGRNTDELLQIMERLRSMPAANDNVPIGLGPAASGGGGGAASAGPAPAAAFNGGAARDLASLPARPPLTLVPPPAPAPAVAPPVTASAPAPISASIGPAAPTGVVVPPALPSMVSGLLPSGAPAPTPAPAPAPDPSGNTASSGPFPIYWPLLLPHDGRDGSRIVSIGVQTIRRSNLRGTSAATSEQIRVREQVIRPDPLLRGTHEAHHVMPMFLNGLDRFPNVVPWPQANHQSQHWRLQHQPQLAGAVWRSPSGALVPLGPYLYTFFGTPGHPDGTPYVVAGFK